MIWADSRIYEYSIRFSILLAVCLVQDLGKDKVEEMEIGVIVEVEVSLDEVDTMSENLSLFLKPNYFSKK